MRTTHHYLEDLFGEDVGDSDNGFDASSEEVLPLGLVVVVDGLVVQLLQLLGVEPELALFEHLHRYGGERVPVPVRHLRRLQGPVRYRAVDKVHKGPPAIEFALTFPTY